MSKTWETLFNLISFMKYLLTKVLPDDKIEAPSYVLDSLYDLLAVTSTWIEKIKPDAVDSASLKNQLAEHSAQLLLSSRSNKTVDGFTSQSNVRKKESPNDIVPSTYYSNKEVNNNGVANPESLPMEISEAFSKLSREMINGRPSGHYCRPCDLSIFSVKDWDNHTTDRLHTFLKEDCEIKLGSCVYCKLAVFASNRDANNLFKYHEVEHNTRNNQSLLVKENISKQETYKIHSKSKASDFVKANLDVVASKVSDIEFHFGPKTSLRISPIFIELDKKMHSGKEKGFYCHICDKAFEVVAEWNKHFQEVDVHNDQFDSSGCFEMCDSCSLVIFAVPSVQRWYMSHHMSGHYCFEKETKSNFKISVESLHSTAQNQENSQSYKNAPFQKNQPNNTYKISQRFKDFNAKIHSHNLQGHFYCRPCNACLSPEDWPKHSVNKKHVELMANRKFKNWKGTCTYCSLTLIGTRDTVKYYMEFHSMQHNKVVSYDFVAMSSENTPNNLTSNQPRRKQRPRKVVSPNSVSTLDDAEDRSDLEENEINNDKFEPAISYDVSGETSWYASSREEQMYDSIRKLIESRTRAKSNSGNPSFGGLCTLCEYTIDNAFDWQDHISSNEHFQRMSHQDRQAYISELNIYLFANINIFEKYKSLIKGNLSFIEN